MIKEKINNLIIESLSNLGIKASEVSLEHPEELKNGDYSTNIALVYAKEVKSNPRELAEKIKQELEKNLPKEIAKVEVAGAGFINFYLSRDFFVDSIKEIIKKRDAWGRGEGLHGKKIIVEYTDPNPFKPFHIGHLMTNAIGESLSRIMEYSGANVVRANYQGDVGPHVAKAIYGMLGAGAPKDENAPVSLLASYIGECYAKGSDAYDTDENAKKEIEEINQKIYARSDDGINRMYDWGRKVTLEAFEELYEILGTKFNHYFFESVMAPIGEKTVRNNLGKVFEESDGAIIFKAEKYDPKLHTRVFINSKGLPTYETKEIGLTETKFEKENPDLSIVVTAIEQGEYMKVVQKALSLIHPDLESRMKHITHGMMKFASGKMSSRKGNVITGESLIRDSMQIIKDKVQDRDMTDEEKELVSRMVGVSAVKYSILRSAITSDIIYDFDRSISFEGDSGPYLQYTAVRARGILKKGEQEGVCEGYKDIPTEAKEIEHLLYKFPEVVARAEETFLPHHISTYLTELASAFNTFYSVSQIVNKSDPYSPYLVSITEAFYMTMRNGLYLLGIETPEKM
ncbi:MAG: arginyl-tRNA synthetase [Patescibacteria group bacterium]|nr:arginyl-tRNA synthetase [Patescibacteria group bacterium]